MVKSFFILLTCFLLQDEIPFKPADEFQVDINLRFKEKPSQYGSNTYNTSGERMDNSKGQQSFLSVKISSLKIREDEIRISVIRPDKREIFKKKTEGLSEFNFDMGFVADLKSEGGEFVILFISPDKKKIRKIVLSITPTGIFSVNGKWHGQF
ncbi:MAG: hypothetical protein JST43_12685 [Bacteroidetes bacterium]|nr:hypothetical protein [Bacteroidota bacterium]MBS1541737.1 hypothetical protein [Bacteroidota bacterium]